eukprot:gb/GECG01002191.1/.p1 GENE.gb/GECG01002191.1/~~gb/GECG01002191.1/.p1  ORF type:complete len:155 (+),score=18.06 gb/GECG01002191.1/:1-465(+)
MATEHEQDNSEFYCRYYVGHKGRFGHEFMEFELKEDGTLRYANNSYYKNDSMIRKQCKVSTAVMHEIRRIVRESEIVKYDDNKWPEPDNVGKQEIEVIDGDTHVAFACTKIGSLLDVQKSEDPEGLKVMYFLVQDLKCLVFSLISMHFKIKPIP